MKTESCPVRHPQCRPEQDNGLKCELTVNSRYTPKSFNVRTEASISARYAERRCVSRWVHCQAWCFGICVVLRSCANGCYQWLPIPCDAVMWVPRRLLSLLSKRTSGSVTCVIMTVHVNNRTPITTWARIAEHPHIVLLGGRTEFIKFNV